MCRLVALAAAFAAVVSACTPVASSQPSSPRLPRSPAALVSPWVGAAPVPGVAHRSHMATLLASGKVLVAGGSTSTGTLLSTSQLYDPATGSWTFTGPLGTARSSATMTRLPSGKVLVVGGTPFAGAELYDPDAGTWSPTGAPATPRSSHTATLLPSGKVLVALGYGIGGVALSSAELYDPVTESWTPAASSGLARLQHTAALLPSGKVLIVGGRSNSFAVLASAELYDPESDSWTPTGGLAEPRFWHVTTALANGKVLVAGGLGAAGALPATELASAELYDPATGTWGPTGPLGTRRRSAQGALLPNGKFLVVGGWATEYATGAELYDPATELWTGVGLLATGRTDHSATVLPSGKVLVAAGYGAPGYLSSAELWSMPGVANSIPVALPQAAVTPEDTRIAIALSGTDADATPLTYSLRSQPAHGVLTGSGASLVYAPTPDFHGLDAFTFVANDGVADSVVASVTIEVTPVNDAPTAQPQAVVLAEGGSLPVLLTGLDVDGDVVTFDVVGPPAHGALTGDGATRTYTPDADFSGTDRFTFTADDGTVSSAATVEILVTAVNDAPVARSLAVATAEDSPLPIALAATDADGDELTFAVSTPPSHGTLTGSGALLAYSPNADYHGADSFTLQANDGQLDSATATVDITVTPVNDPPVARPGSVTLPEDAVTSVTLLATDAEGDALTYAIVTPPAHGTLSGSGASLSYQPAADYNGPDAFSFVANDGAADSAPVTIAIDVSPVDEPSDEAKGSSGCSTTGGISPLGVLLVGMLGLLRRRRDPITTLPRARAR